MCIAIYKPEKITLLDTTLEACWENNPHGAGFMYVEKKKLKVVKGLMTYQEFLDAYEPHKNKTCVLHFRIRTHGATNAENTHPFLIDDKLGMVHNGIMSNVACDINKDMNDTWHFTEKFLKHFRKVEKDFWLDDRMKDLFESFIGHSKLILMDNLENVVIFNSSLGVWNTDCWFSNTSYTARTTYPTYKRPHKVEYSNVTPIIQQEQPTSTLFKIGDVVLLNCAVSCTKPLYEFECLPINTRVRIDYFGQGNYVGVSDTLSGKRGLVALHNITPVLVIPKRESTTLKPSQDWASNTEDFYEDTTFKPGDEVVFSKNFNHFRIGVTKRIEKVTHNFVIIKGDSPSTKSQAVPKTHVKPISCLFNSTGEQLCH